MRILYWSTACLEPGIEAVSKEVCELATHFAPSLVFSVSPHVRLRFRRSPRSIGCHPVFDPFLRIIVPWLERTATISHVYAEPCPWLFYKTLRRKPLVLTVATEQGGLRVDFLERCRKIFVQTEPFKARLTDEGLDPRTVEVMYPGVDLASFVPGGARRTINEPVRLLCATVPRSHEEMEARGIPVLLEAAEMDPTLAMRLLHRPWKTGDTSLAGVRRLVAHKQLPNVWLTQGDIGDMAQTYRDHDFIVIPYTRPDGGKECPRSLIEALACGRPALVSTACPMASFIQDRQCGVAFEPTAEGLLAALERGKRRYEKLAKNAREVAERFFSQTTMLARLEQTYQEIARKR